MPRSDATREPAAIAKRVVIVSSQPMPAGAALTSAHSYKKIDRDNDQCARAHGAGREPGAGRKWTPGPGCVRAIK
eukprot:scaffold6552_cov61-Phaeocystis_antarctica.AAC.4